MLAWLFLALALGHDFYLEATPATVEVGDTVFVLGVVANHDEREVRTERPASLLRLDAVVDGKAAPLSTAPSLLGKPTAWGLLQPKAAGVVPIVYTNEGAEVTLEHGKFLSYLSHEGDDRMTSVAAALTGPQKEHYRRSLKALVRVGEADTGWDAVVGLPLELVPRSDPFSRPDGGLTLELLADGKPARDVRVRAFPAKGDSHDAVVKRTDADGRVTLTLPQREGGWVVAAVSMSHDAARETPWSSTWTTLRLP